MNECSPKDTQMLSTPTAPTLVRAPIPSLLAYGNNLQWSGPPASPRHAPSPRPPEILPQTEFGPDSSLLQKGRRFSFHFVDPSTLPGLAAGPSKSDDPLPFLPLTSRLCPQPPVSSQQSPNLPNPPPSTSAYFTLSKHLLMLENPGGTLASPGSQMLLSPGPSVLCSAGELTCYICCLSTEQPPLSVFFPPVLPVLLDVRGDPVLTGHLIGVRHRAICFIYLTYFSQLLRDVGTVF